MANKKLNTVEVQIKMVECVPFQVCPLCLGTGRIDGLPIETVTSSQCDVCNGSKVIPMAVVPAPEDFTDHNELRR